MSQASSGYARIDGDRYYTPAWVTEALLSVERFDGGVWDPAAGAGHILRALPADCRKLGSDIEPDSDPDDDLGVFASDFLAFGDAYLPNIITNPPYGTGGRLAVQFVEQALRLTAPFGGKVAMLLRVDFDSANGRRKIFEDHPAFAAKYVLTRRIRWANLPQSDAGPTVNHQWLVWDWRRRSGMPRTVSYLPLVSEDI
ncbi:MAG: hypothetical protein WD472_11350 [Dehalococcoidia bacterium]